MYRTMQFLPPETAVPETQITGQVRAASASKRVTISLKDSSAVLSMDVGYDLKLNCIAVCMSSGFTSNIDSSSHDPQNLFPFHVASGIG